MAKQAFPPRPLQNGCRIGSILMGNDKDNPVSSNSSIYIAQWSLIIPGRSLFYIRRKPAQKTRLKAFLRLHQHDGVGTDVSTSGHTLVLQI